MSVKRRSEFNMSSIALAYILYASLTVRVMFFQREASMRALNSEQFYEIRALSNTGETSHLGWNLLKFKREDNFTNKGNAKIIVLIHFG